MTNDPLRRTAPAPVNGFLPASGVRYCRLGEDCLVFDEAAQAISRLDPLSGALWEALAAGRAREEIARDLADALGRGIGEAEAFIAACFDEWRTRGLLHSKGEQAAAEETGFGRADEPARAVGPASRRQKVSAGKAYLIGGLTFSVSFPDAVTFSAWEAVAGHMRTGATDMGAIVLSVVRDGAGYRIDHPGGAEAGLEDASAVAVHLKEQVLRLILARMPGGFALHAAALEHDGAAVLLAGGSGRGKTTLAAALHAKGLPVVSDDVVLIEPARPAVGGLAFSFAVKTGSVDVLAPMLGRLPAEPGYLRPDGKTVKYFRPRHWTAGAARIGAVVFPRYTPGQACTLTPCTRAEALTTLLGEAVNADHRLSTAGFAALCELLGNADCLKAEYGDAGEASSRLLFRLGKGAQ